MTLQAVAVLLCCLIVTSNARVAVPVVASSVSRLAPNVFDVAVDSYHDVLYVSNVYNAVYRAAANGSALLLVGSGSSSTGTADGVGSDVRFRNPTSLTCDTANNTVYISDKNNCRIRVLFPANNTVTTLAGNSCGHRDEVGTIAEFSNPWGIAYHSSGVLYVAQQSNPSYVRRIHVSTVNVTTVGPSSSDFYYFLCVNKLGTIIYVASYYSVIQVNVSTGAVLFLTGARTSNYADGPWSAAMFASPRGIALNSDESALIITDQGNGRIRKVDFATKNVTTLAGNGLNTNVDGPGLASSFYDPLGAKWHCTILARCGVLVADTDNNAVRFVSIETATSTVSDSAVVTSTSSRTMEASTEVTRSLSATTSTSRMISVSASKSFTAQLSLTASRIATGTRELTLSCATLTRSSLTLSPVISLSTTPAATNTSRVSLSVTKEATTSHSRTSISRTQHSASQSTTTYCALVPGEGESSVGSTLPTEDSPSPGKVQSFHPDAAPDGVVTLQATRVQNASSASVAPVSRTALLQNLPLGVNLSLSLGGTIRGGPLDGWGLDGAVINVWPRGTTFPLLTAPVPLTLLSTVVVGQKQSLQLLLGPPNVTTSPRWLPTSLSTFRDVTLELLLTLRCPLDKFITANVMVKVTCPGEVQPLASEVRVAGSVAQYSASFASPGTGPSVARLASVRFLVMCNGGPVVEGMLPLTVDACDDTTASGARGGILGNFVLWVTGSLMMVVAVVAYMHLTHTSMRIAREALAVPSLLMPLAVVTLPSTVSSVFYSLSTDACSTNVVLAILGISMCFGVLIALIVIACAAQRHWMTLVQVQHDPNKSRVTRRWLSSTLLLVVGRLFHRHAKWRQIDDEKTTKSTTMDRCVAELHSSTKMLMDT